MLVSPVAIRRRRSKGNRVKIPDRPAAVSFILFVPDQFSCHCLKHDGKASGTEASQKTCQYKQASVLRGLSAASARFIITVLLKHRKTAMGVWRYYIMWPYNIRDTQFTFEGPGIRILSGVLFLGNKKATGRLKPVTCNYKY